MGALSERAAASAAIALRAACSGIVNTRYTHTTQKRLYVLEYSHLSKVLVIHFSAGAATTFPITKIAVTQQQILHNKE